VSGSFSSSYVAGWYAWTSASAEVAPSVVRAVAKASTWSGVARFRLRDIASTAGISVKAASDAVLRLERQGHMALRVAGISPDDECEYQLDAFPSQFLAQRRQEAPAAPTSARQLSVVSFWAVLPDAVRALCSPGTSHT
jgi:hypothetical protein